MGLPMAENLGNWLAENQLPPLTVWNRTASKLPEAGTKYKHATSPAEMANSLDIIFTSLGSDQAARATYDQLFEGARERAAAAKKAGSKPSTLVFVETSTVSNPGFVTGPVSSSSPEPKLTRLRFAVVPSVRGRARARGVQDPGRLLPPVPCVWSSARRAGRSARVRAVG